jgi:hypothetical protein
MNNGREIILNRIKKGAKSLIIAGSIIAGIMFLIVGFIALVCIMNIIESGADETLDGATPVFVISAILLCIGIIGVFMIRAGLKRIKNPMQSKVLKNNPDLLFMADELFRGITYQDDNLIMSDRVVANKKNLFQMAFYNEIFMVYVHTESYNFITTTKQLVLATARDEIIIGIYGMKSEKVNHLAETIASKCPYARFGYTQENLKYLQEMRNTWQRAKLDQQMGISRQQLERDRLQHEQAIASGQQAYYSPDQTM